MTRAVSVVLVIAAALFCARRCEGRAMNEFDAFVATVVAVLALALLALKAAHG